MKRSMLVLLVVGLCMSERAQSAELTQSAFEEPLQAPPDAAHEKWRAAISSKTASKEGCFTATFPSEDWVEVECVHRPPVPHDVGNGLDNTAIMTGGTITQADGFFYTNGLTGEYDTGGAYDYFSVQANSNFHSFGACPGSSNPSCHKWQQFIFDGNAIFSGGLVYMQYWMIGYNASCPSGWTQHNSDCFKNSGQANTPPVTIGVLANVNLHLSGKIFTVFPNFIYNSATAIINNTAYYVNALDVGLNGRWTSTEFNVFGWGHGSKACFNSGTTLQPWVTLHGSGSSASCSINGTTGETNNLSLVGGTCGPLGPPDIGITFQETWTQHDNDCPSGY